MTTANQIANLTEAQIAELKGILRHDIADLMYEKDWPLERAFRVECQHIIECGYTLHSFIDEMRCR